MLTLKRNAVITVDELLASVDWSKLPPGAPQSRVVLLAIDAGIRAACTDVLVKRPKLYGQKQLTLNMRRAT
jgi:hypothetical protein